MDQGSDRRSAGGTGEFFQALTAEFAFVAYCRARYLTPGKNGETRAERNEAFGAESVTPEWSVPVGGQYLIDWFDELSSGHNRIVGNQAKRISWQEFLAWRDATGNIVYPHEFAILRAMDVSHCEALDEELQYAVAKAKAEMEAAAEAARKKKG